ncbi:MAG: hypothetical protein JWO07_643 [Candidatus Saccharibacteria bacterium]|nr:hypothetical protein [Candidatus Saccharibacteria bacterium]
MGMALLLSLLFTLSGQTFAHALTNDSKLFISADNTFYAYVKAGETIGASFTRVNQDEPFDTVRGDVTVTIDGPSIQQQTCVMSKDVPIGQGCAFAAQTAQKSGIWRVQFMVPANARTYDEVSPVVKWAKNLFNWNITVNGSTGEQHGRIWTEQYAIRQPAPATFLDDLKYYYISEDGYIYKSTEYGYNGQISTLSADSIGLRSGMNCVSAYQSTDVSNAKFSPALGTCGNGYKLFFEEPSGELPTSATKWDGKTDWVRPNISHPNVSGLHFQSDNSRDQQSGTISFYLHNFTGQYQVKIDTDGDGSFDGQSDVTLNEQMKKLSNDQQQIHFDGADRQGQVIPTTQSIGIKVNITKVAEIHLVAADVEGRTGGIELTRLSGDNAPTTGICWNDTELAALADPTLMTKKLDGRDCPDSTGGVHGWAYNDGSWGNARYIDDWVYASATLDGNNQISFPDVAAQASSKKTPNWVLIAVICGVIVLVVTGGVIIAVRKRGKNKNKMPPPTLPIPPTTPQPPMNLPPPVDGPPTPEN